MIPEAKTPVQPCLIPLEKEAEAAVVEEEGDEESPLVGDAGAPVFEDLALGDVDEELVEPLLQHTPPTASLSKGQVLRTPPHRRRGPVQWHLVPVVLPCRGMATSVIQWHVMIVRQLDIHLFKVQKTARLDLHLTRLRALTVSSLHLRHESFRDLC